MGAEDVLTMGFNPWTSCYPTYPGVPAARTIWLWSSNPCIHQPEIPLSGSTLEQQVVNNIGRPAGTLWLWFLSGSPGWNRGLVHRSCLAALWSFFRWDLRRALMEADNSLEVLPAMKPAYGSYLTAIVIDKLPSNTSFYEFKAPHIRRFLKEVKRTETKEN